MNQHILTGILLSLTVFSCQRISNETIHGNAQDSLTSSQESRDSLATSIDPITIASSDEFIIVGDFNGDGKSESGFIRLIKEGVLHEQPWQYILEFSDTNIPPIAFASDVETGGSVIREEFLDNYPGEELSIITPLNMNNTAIIHSYSFRGQWKELTEGLFCPNVLPDSLNYESLIFKEDNEIFFYEWKAMSDENEDSATSEEDESIFKKRKLIIK